MLIEHSWYRFPKNGARRAQWINCLGLSKFDHHDRVCGKHFSINDYREGESLKLKKTAFPIRFEPQSLNHEVEPENEIGIVEQTLRRSVRKRKRTRKIEQSITWVNMHK